jgi:phage-related protein
VEWRVELLNDAVRNELLAFSAEIRAQFARITDLICLGGLQNLRAPHVKHLEGKLWEIRLTDRDGIVRVLYVTASGRRVVVVRAFQKKTQKTPRAEIDLALRRAKEIQ